MNIGNNYDKCTLPNFKLKTAFNEVLIFFVTLMIDTIKYWMLDKNYPFFRTYIFAWIL